MVSGKSRPQAPGVAPVIERKSVWVLGVLTIVLFCASLVAMWRAHNEQNRWVQVDARMFGADIVNFKRFGATWYRVEGEYLYVARGERYRVPYSFPRVTSSLPSITEDQLSLASQRTQRIFYNPADPEDITTDLAGERFFVPPIVLALLAVLCGIALLVRVVRWSDLSCNLCGSVATGYDRFCSRCGAPMPARKGRPLPEGGFAEWWQKRTAPKPHDRPLRDYGRIAGLLFGAFAAILFFAAAWETAGRTWWMVRWKPVNASVVASSMATSHDGKARFEHRLEASMRYEDGGVTRIASARSGFFSKEFSWISGRRNAFAPGSRHRIWVNPGNPGIAYFGSLWPVLASDGLPELASVALICVFLSILSLRVWKPDILCAACRFRLDRHSRFCPFCRAPVGLNGGTVRAVSENASSAAH